MMKVLLPVARAIDALNERVGRTVIWLVLVMVLVSTVNALVRYLFNQSSNAWLELQWYLFAAVFLLCAGYTLLHNEHIRIDVVSSRFSARTPALDRRAGHRAVPAARVDFRHLAVLAGFHECLGQQRDVEQCGRVDPLAGRLLVPVGFLLLSLQGISELIKRIAVLMGLIPNPMAAPPPPLPVPGSRAQ